MTSDDKALNRVLRAQITAVHQQFVHVLGLRQWGLEDMAKRILEVDRIDFPVAMKIIDYMVSSGKPVELEPDPFTPGACEAEVVAAELLMEQRLHAALLAADISTPPASKLIATALAPRQDYADWLSARTHPIATQEREESDLVDTFAQVFSHIIVMIEQAMTHAFVHWHHGQKTNADSAWATSGAAMMLATRIVKWFAARREVPVPKTFPSLRISDQPDEAVEFDRQLVNSFASCTEALSEVANEEVREWYRTMSQYAIRLSNWEPGQEHPAKVSNPPAFQSFEATLAKFVWSR